MSRPPDYVLKIKNKDPKDKATTRAGSAWLNPAGDINIILNPGIVLGLRDDLMLTLFPQDKASVKPAT